MALASNHPMVRHKVHKMSEMTVFTCVNVVSVLKRSTLREVAPSSLGVRTVEERFRPIRTCPDPSLSLCSKSHVKAALCPASPLEKLPSCSYFEEWSLEGEKGFVARLAYAFLRNTFGS